jgi:hypothetical protein
MTNEQQEEAIYNVLRSGLVQIGDQNWYDTVDSKCLPKCISKRAIVQGIPISVTIASKHRKINYKIALFPTN